MNQIRALLGETAIGYAYWTLIHGLGPMIWFYPLNELDITGYEAYVLVALSPVLLLFGRCFRSLFSSRYGQGFLRLLMIVGLASFQSPDTLTRLGLLALGNAAAYLLQGTSWCKQDLEERRNVFWGWILGFFALLATRIWFVSLTPAWADERTNNFVITIVTIAALDRTFSSKESDKTSDSQEFKPSNDSHILSGIGFGSLYFLLHALYGEVSIISRYSVSGIPHSGPSPNPWGGLIFIALAFGIFMSMHINVRSILWCLIGLASGMGLMFLPGNSAYLSGTVLALFTTSVWAVIADRMLATQDPVKCLVISNFIYIANLFAMVWCTAYNFVPIGGEYSRERTYVLIAFAILAMSYVVLRSSDSSRSGVSLRLSMPSPTDKEKISKKSKEDKRQKEDTNFGQLVKLVLLTIVIGGLLGFESRTTTISSIETTKDSVKKPNKFSALIWTFHFGYDNTGWPNLERAAKIFKDTDADVIVLLESDASKPYLGNNDLAMWFGEKLGFYVDFGPSTRDHTWGNLLLSRYPIVNSTHHLLPSPEGELAPAISATININGRHVDFVTSHMGNDRDDLDRKLQAAYLSELADQTPRPVVMLSYVTSAVRSRDYLNFVENGRLKDIDPTDKERWCQYIMYRGLIRLGYARISHGGLSDTEIQMGRWEIPPRDFTVKDHSKIVKDPSLVTEEDRFSEEFGEFFNSHWWGESSHFHMSTPKYFI